MKTLRYYFEIVAGMENNTEYFKSKMYDSKVDCLKAMIERYEASNCSSDDYDDDEYGEDIEETEEQVDEAKFVCAARMTDTFTGNIFEL